MSRKLIWHPICDLPTSWTALKSTELASLGSIWREQARQMGGAGALGTFNEKLAREWAIETGIIEGLYAIDRGTTRLLIEHGWVASMMPHGSTDRPAGEIVDILRDHEQTLEGLFDFVKRSRELSTSYIKELHALLTSHQTTTEAFDQFGARHEVELVRGDWKRVPNNPSRPNGTTYVYCPPEQVASEMDRLIDMHRRHDDVPPEVEAAWLHHRFAQIHPFQDGNGRVARALSSLIFIRHGWFPLVVDRDRRGAYIKVLERADEGDLSELVALFASIQKRFFLRALSLSHEILRTGQPAEAVIASALERLRARFDERLDDRRRVLEMGDHLIHDASLEMGKIASTVRNEIKKIDPKYGAEMLVAGADKMHWYNRDTIEIARKLGYFADTTTYKKWCRLAIYEARDTHIVISIHSLGREFVGVLAASAFVRTRHGTEEGVTADERPYPLSEEVFQFAFNEDADVVKHRFTNWLRSVLLAGLETWRRGV